MNYFGGNSGYIGFSESIRSAEAKERGSYPRTLFCKEYGISPKLFAELLKRGIIEQDGWHHTSKFGNKTNFYKIANAPLFYLKAGDKQRAYLEYMQQRAHIYCAQYSTHDSTGHYLQGIILSKGDDNAAFLKNMGCEYKRTKRGNYCFYLQKSFLQNANYRDIFKNKN